MTDSRKLGLAGAVLYTLASYRLVNVYVRAAAGEYTAMIFFPFPWRFLSAATAVLIPAVLFAIAEWRRHDRAAACAAMLALCAVTIIGVGYFFHGYTDAADEASAVFASNLDTMNVGYAEYLPASIVSSEEFYVKRVDVIYGNVGFE